MLTVTTEASFPFLRYSHFHRACPNPFKHKCKWFLSRSRPSKNPIGKPSVEEGGGRGLQSLEQWGWQRRVQCFILSHKVKTNRVLRQVSASFPSSQRKPFLTGHMMKLWTSSPQEPMQVHRTTPGWKQSCGRPVEVRKRCEGTAPCLTSSDPGSSDCQRWRRTTR